MADFDPQKILDDATRKLEQSKFFADQINNGGPALKLTQQKIAEVLMAELGNPTESVPYAFAMVTLQRMMAVLMIDRVEAIFNSDQHKDKDALSRAFHEAALLDHFVSMTQQQMPGLVEEESINRMTPEQKSMFTGLKAAIYGGQRRRG